MPKTPNLFRRFFQVYADPHTWLNLVYLFLMFPLGLFYFIVMISGLSLGVALFILWVGVLVLAATFILGWAFTALERLLAVHLLGAKIPEQERLVRPDAPFLEKLKSYATNSRLWKGIAYLFIKFPLGIITFTILSILLGISLGFIASPFLLPFLHINWIFWSVVVIPIGIIGFALGVLLLTTSMHLFNFGIRFFRNLAEALLGG